MKHILIFITVLLLLFSQGCGKKSSLPKSDTNQTTQKVQTDAPSESENTQKEENTKDTKKEETISIETPEDFENIIDEFNTTENPERKEELRQTLEQILANAEAAYEEQSN